MDTNTIVLSNPYYRQSNVPNDGTSLKVLTKIDVSFGTGLTSPPDTGTLSATLSGSNAASYETFWDSEAGATGPTGVTVDQTNPVRTLILRITDPSLTFTTMPTITFSVSAGAGTLTTVTDMDKDDLPDRISATLIGGTAIRSISTVDTIAYYNNREYYVTTTLAEAVNFTDDYDPVTATYNIGNGNAEFVITSNLTTIANFAPLLQDTNNFNDDISKWDTANVTDMTAVFYGNGFFDRDIGAWDTSNVTLMGSMFRDNNQFTYSLNNWDVSSVTDMNRMFENATSFNQDLDNWDVSSVTDMSYMFFNNNAFNGNIVPWDVSNVTNMDFMFSNVSPAAFNQDLGGTWCPNIETKPANFESNTGNWDLVGGEEVRPVWGKFKPVVSSTSVYATNGNSIQFTITYLTGIVVSSFGDFSSAELGGTPVTSPGTFSSSIADNVVTVTYTAPSTGDGTITIYSPYGQAEGNVNLNPASTFSGRSATSIVITYGATLSAIFNYTYDQYSIAFGTRNSAGTTFCFTYSPVETDSYDELNELMLRSLEDYIRVNYYSDYELPTLTPDEFYFYNFLGSPEYTATTLADFLLTGNTVNETTETKIRNFIGKIFGIYKNFFLSFFNNSTGDRSYTYSYRNDRFNLVKRDIE